MNTSTSSSGGAWVLLLRCRHWISDYGKGKVFYGSPGHNPKIFQNQKLMRFYLDGIQFALRDIEADTTPSGARPAPRIKR